MNCCESSREETRDVTEKLHRSLAYSWISMFVDACVLVIMISAIIIVEPTSVV